MEKVSVIVPVYNAGDYLERCIDSVLSQTYSHLELILVNDGSTDHSGAICDRYVAQDSRVRVFHKENAGVGATRNFALEQVTGDYLLFVDNDDWLDENHIQELYQQMLKTGADISGANFVEYVDETSQFLFYVGASDYFEKVYTPFDWFENQYEGTFNLSQCFTVPWGKLYKASLFDTIVYPSNRSVEDDFTTYKVYLKANKIAFMNKALYTHRKLTTSVTKSVDLTEVYPLESIEERVMILTLANAPKNLIDLEKKAYEWRLAIHKEAHFNAGRKEAYKQALTKFGIHYRSFEDKSQVSGHALVVTGTQDLARIEELVCGLPQVDFHIAARTAMGPKLLMLDDYANVHLYPGCQPEQLSTLVEQADLYLDINFGNPDWPILEHVQQRQLPIFAFYKTLSGSLGQFTYSSERYKEMEEAIEDYLVQGQLPVQEPLLNSYSIKETLDYLEKNQSSLIRFGDGEISIMAGLTIAYQKQDAELAEELKNIISLQSNEELLICVPDGIKAMFELTDEAIEFWKGHFDHYDSFYRELCTATWYGTTSVSRPYIGLQDKSQSGDYFKQLKRFWEDKDLLIVEGDTTRSGVGNDLFANAASIERIIGPSHDAYAKVDELEQAIRQYGKDKLVLIMLGPTAKVLVHRLAKEGYHLLDIGHIDSEYEWYQMKAETKVKLNHKHTAEFNFDQGIEFLESPEYNQQIVLDLSK